MKPSAFSVFLIFATFIGTASAQTNTFPPSGDAGVGTNSPTVRFQVQKGSSAPAIMIGGGFSGSPRLQVYGLGDDPNAWAGLGMDMGGYNYEHTIYFPTGPTSYAGRLSIGNYNGSQYQSRFTVLANGNVGVGTQYPKSLLDVGKSINGEQLGTVLGRLTEGDDQLEGTFLGVRGYGTQSNDYDGKSFALEHSFYGRKNSSINFYRGGGQIGGFITFSTFDNSERMRISPFGNVGIGTSNPTEKLSVNGNIRAKEIKVETANWPDYVFDQDYKILGLQELDAYIKQHKHLPDMPSSKEVEFNGIELGEMNKLLLKKVEELTLHLIEKDKQFTTQQEELTEIKNLLQKLTEKK